MVNTDNQQATVITGRNLGGIQFDVTLDESHEDGLEITEHPVEHGANINDHAYLKPASVAIRAGVSDAGPDGGDGHSREVYEKLRQLQASREPFSIVTGKRLYENMLLETLTVVTDANTEHALIVSAACRQVIIVHTRVASVPPRARHASPGKTGGTTDKGQKQPQRSMTAAAAGGGHTRAEWEAGAGS